jgi:hypothetical protein
VVSLGSGPLRLHDGVVAIPLTCSAGDGGCAGTLRIRPGAATATYVVAAGSTTTLNVPLPRRASRLASARLAFTPVIGRGPSTLVETSITTG